MFVAAARVLTSSGVVHTHAVMIWVRLRISSSLRTGTDELCFYALTTEQGTQLEFIKYLLNKQVNEIDLGKILNPQIISKCYSGKQVGLNAMMMLLITEGLPGKERNSILYLF